MAPAKLRYTMVSKGHWYFRHHPLPSLMPLKGQPGDPVFHRAYTALLEQVQKEAAAIEQRKDERSLRILVDAYQQSLEWTELRPDTQRSYKRELERLLRLAGDLPFASMTKAGVLALRRAVKAEVIDASKAKIAARVERDKALEAAGKPASSRRAKPKESTGTRTTDIFTAVLSALYSWAEDNALLPPHFANPAGTVKKLQNKKNNNKKVMISWEEPHIEMALANAPAPVAAGIILGLHTGQRLEDVVKARLWQCTGSIFQVTQSKTNASIVVPITGPMVDLGARRRAEKGDYLLVQENGKPYTKRLFSEHLRAHLDSLGLHHLSFHGLRYAAAGRLADAGCTVATISDIIGHSTYEMAQKYLGSRERRGRVVEAMEGASANRAE